MHAFISSTNDHLSRAGIVSEEDYVLRKNQLIEKYMGGGEKKPSVGPQMAPRAICPPAKGGKGGWGAPPAVVSQCTTTFCDLFLLSASGDWLVGTTIHSIKGLSW